MMTEENRNDCIQMNLLAKAVRFNHDKSGKFKVMVTPDKEIEKYESRITQLTLPAKFGMYKPQTKNVPVKDVDSYTLDDDAGTERKTRTSYNETHPNHHVRKML